MTQRTCIAQVRPWVPSLAVEKKGEGGKAGGRVRGEGGEGREGAEEGMSAEQRQCFSRLKPRAGAQLVECSPSSKETLNSITDAM